MVASPVARQAVRGFEGHGDAVHAVAQTGRLRTVVEDVAEMAAAAAAVHGRAHHAERACRCWSPTALSSGAQKLGQPVPLSNFVVEENRSRSQPAQANVPAPLLVQQRAGERRARSPPAAAPRTGRASAACAIRRRCAADLEWLGTCGMSSNEAGKPHAAHDECAPCDHRMHPLDARPQRHLIPASVKFNSCCRPANPQRPSILTPWSEPRIRPRNERWRS